MSQLKVKSFKCGEVGHGFCDLSEVKISHLVIFVVCFWLHRNSANEITVVVWRTGPSAKPNFEGLIHRPTYKPSTSNYDAPSPPTRRRDVSASKTPPAVPPLPAHHRATAARRLLVNGSEAGNNSGLGTGTLAWGAQGGSIIGRAGWQTTPAPPPTHCHTERNPSEGIQWRQLHHPFPHQPWKPGTAEWWWAPFSSSSSSSSSSESFGGPS